MPETWLSALLKCSMKTKLYKANYSLDFFVLKITSVFHHPGTASLRHALRETKDEEQFWGICASFSVYAVWVCD